MSPTAKEIVLITGATSGIGFELAHQLLQKGIYHILLGTRTPQRGTLALATLQSRSKYPGTGTIELLHLDVTNDTHIASAATHITQRHGRLDVLVNNAGIASFAAADRAAFRNAFDTNATGPYLLTKALMPLLRKSGNPRVINVSSGAGSIGRRLSPQSPMYGIQAEPYRASKVAMNMLACCLFVEFGLGVGQLGREKGQGKEGEGEDEIGLGEEEKEKRIKVFAYDPGFTVSNLSEANTVENGARSAEETVVSLMEVVEGKRDADVGKFIHNTGEYPW